MVLCGDIPLRSHFETETLLNLLPAFFWRVGCIVAREPKGRDVDARVGEFGAEVAPGGGWS